MNFRKKHKKTNLLPQKVGDFLHFHLEKGKIILRGKSFESTK
jgi:hypothetical protein